MTSFDSDPTDLQSPQSGERSAPASLSSAHILKALQDSPDNGATLIFSRLRLSDVGPAEELANIGRENSQDQGSLKRLALDHNRLTTLPTEFALLSRLRYLNLRHNNFSVFPDVLTLIPSLDTLDMACNKLKVFPSDAGQLVNLRVFCLSRNKVVRLPPYLTLFRNLEVLQVERNPIEWPPKHVTRPTGGLDSSLAMQEWIRGLQKWMELDSKEKHSDSRLEERGSSNSIAWKFPSRNNNSPTPRIRPFSVDSHFSVSSTADSFQESPTHTSNESRDRPPLHLGMLGTSSAQPSPTRSFESYLPSPADLESFPDSDIAPLDDLRTNSWAASEDRPDLSTKAQISDLAVVELKCTSEKVSSALPAVERSTTPFHHRCHDEFLVPTALQPPPQGSGLDAEFRFQANGPAAKEPRRLLPVLGTFSAAHECDSYFRRLSALPAPTTLPTALICLIDSTRSILSAISEVYQSLDRYLIYITDDKNTCVLRKVLDSASVEILQLINSLDRFDAICQKMFPPPAMCRGVIESCKDAVAMFNKTFGVLGSHLKVGTGDHVRYARWLLLVLHGAAAEVSSAWQSMVSEMDLIKPLLRSKNFSQFVFNSVGSEAYLPTTSLTSTDLTVWPRPTGKGISTAATVAKGRTARRHAGSFSSKDVEIGRHLPSYDDFPGTFAGIAPTGVTHIPLLRAPKRQMTIPLTTIQSSPTIPIPQPSSSKNIIPYNDFLNTHSRQGSEASLASASYSPSLPLQAISSELPTNSRSQVGKEALQAVYTAVDIAPIVCDMIEDVLGDILKIKTSVRDTIKQARVATTRLSDTARMLEKADTDLNAQILREDARTFLKNIVRLSGVVKAHAGFHSVLRSNMVKLTSSTEEFAILLHVASFTLSTTPRPYTPTLTISIDNTSANSVGFDEKRLRSSLSRSRSTHEPPTFKLQPQPDSGARSAIPPGPPMFQIPNARRLRSREHHIDIADPG